ncbi:uncharacterized protein N0V89_006479 [Didymosphaeria variabile]|uniref:Protein kinase domain-containing protein n=1 Tax=Didymosphaeria variabile TaxID=1932322 RepID=A0A9W8XJM1_9PLEO|nr:uncharacterized protein N0V89_006479 [Didymosphaeria variabile]KAJ4351140.1 hypothetical protein N0V89_006479 [Didymosphaeria variabile]
MPIASALTVLQNPWVDTSREGTYDSSSIRQDLEMMGIQWSPELQDVQENIEPVEPVVGVPPYYLEVLEAGRGVHGTVVLCLPRPYAIAAKHDSMQGSPHPIAELKSKLVAAKTAKDWPAPIKAAQNEARIHEMLAAESMRRLRASTLPQFASLRGRSSIDASPLHGLSVHKTYWLAIDAIVPSMTVADLWWEHPPKLEGDAEVLMLQVFCGLYDAIRFLHTCNPPIVHNDVHAGNVMLQLSDGLPRVVLTDFGSAKQEENDFDFQCVRNMINFMYVESLDFHRDSPTVPKGWPEFKDTLITRDYPNIFEPLLKLAEPLARSALANVDSKSKSDISSRLQEAAKPKEAKLLTNFQRMGLLPGGEVN